MEGPRGWSIEDRARTLVLAAAFAIAGCSPRCTTMWPYSRDGQLDELLTRRAATTCGCLRAGADLPPRRFTTDGCSMSPDEDWAGCCVAHDIEYWCGGSREDRVAADDRFARCIERLGHGRRLARAMRGAVRLGGAPTTPWPWRWGYGWSGIRGYDAASHPGDADACLGR